MRLLSLLASLWRNIAQRSLVERDLDEELQAYLGLLADQKMKAGMSRAAAVRAARLETGGVEQVKEEVRAARVGALLDALVLDVRHAVRSLVRTPGFTVVAVLTLAVGIGATTAIFSVVEGVLLRSLPFLDAGRLVVITPNLGWVGPLEFYAASPWAAYQQWQATGEVFEGSAVYLANTPVVRGRGPAERIGSASVSAGFFSLLGARPLLGRSFVAAEDRPGSSPTVVLSRAFWVDRMGANPNVIGQTLTLDTTAYLIVGVMADRTLFPADAKVWTNFGALLGGRGWPAGAHQYYFSALGRLKPGDDAAAAQQEVRALSARAWTPNPSPGALHWLPTVISLRDTLTGAVRPRLLLMLGAVLLVLVIACANVAGLVFSRTLARQHLIAMRAALGARRARLVQGVLAETALLGLSGGWLGLLGAGLCLPILVKGAANELPRLTSIALDARIVVLCLGVSLVTGIAAGVLPAWHAASLPPADVLKAGGWGATASPRRRLSGALIVGQLALTTILLAGSALLLRSFALLNEIDPGFDFRHLIIGEVQLPVAGYAHAAQQAAYVQRVLERVGEIPGLTTTAVGTGIPLAAGAYAVAGPPGKVPSFTYWAAAVTPDYFRALGVPLIRGRTFVSVDPGALVIDSAMARQFFPGEDPIGRVYALGPNFSRTIVGVVGDVRQSLTDSPAPHVYMPYSDVPSSFIKVLAVTRGDPGRSVAAVRKAIEQVDAGVPVAKVEPMTGLMAESLARQRFYSFLVITFGIMALFLAAAGVYGLGSYTVSRRAREFGVRMALGAGGRRVMRLVIWRALGLASAGCVLGLAGAVAATRTLKALLFEVGPIDPRSLLGAVAVLFVVTVAATYFPARRAARIDPVTALRSE